MFNQDSELKHKVTVATQHFFLFSKTPLEKWT